MSAIDLGMDFQMPKNQSSQIKVMGVGGGGSNAVNYMYENGIKGVDFVVCNTDSQALEASPVPVKIQLGATITEGLGAGSNPEVGREAAIESSDKITELLDANTKMLFLTAGMGGGTGTGAAPIIAEVAREKGILTVGVVTIPFSTEGGFRKRYAEEGISELKKFVDTLLVINNEKLIEVYGDLTFTNAFAKANEVLNTATKGIAEVISQHLLVNIDLNDARKVLENSGTAVMGQATAEGENRAIEAVSDALDSPLLNDNDITGAQQVLLKIVTSDGDDEMKMSEMGKIKNAIQKAAGGDVNIIEGIGVDPALGAKISITVIATGFEQKRKPKEKTTVSLDNELDEAEKESTFLNSKVDNLNIQQNLGFDDEIDHIIPVSNDGSFERKIEDNELEIKSLVKSEDKAERIVFDLGHEYSDEVVKEKYSENLIPDIMDEEPNLDNQVLQVSNDDIEDEIVPADSNINTIDNTKVNTDVIKVEARERESRLRNISMQLRTPSGLTSLEDVPAYKRSNIEIDESSHSSDIEASKYTLSNGKNNTVELKKNNPFLHDNVD